MQGLKRENGVTREYCQGQYGGYWKMVVNCETGPLWPSFCHVEGESWQEPHPGIDTGNGIRLVDLDEVFDMSPDYTPIFRTQGERDTFEHTPYEQSAPMYPHEVADTCPRHLRPEELRYQARCTPREAVHFADLLSILEASEEIAATFCRWSRIKGAQPTLNYLYRLCLALAEVEAVSAEDALDGYTHNEVHAAETIGYHRVYSDKDCTPDWIESRSYWFQNLISTVQAGTDIPELKQLCKEVYPHLHGSYMSVFLTFYDNRMSYLESRARKFRSKPTRVFISRIEEAKSYRQLASIGANLYKLQKGTIKGPEIKPVEWGFIWEAYNAAKARLAPTKH